MRLYSPSPHDPQLGVMGAERGVGVRAKTLSNSNLVFKMAQIMIQVPDELAQRLEPLQNYLPEALARLADSLTSSNPDLSFPRTISGEISPVYQEILDFLTASPTPEAIATFKVSANAQTRLRTLLERSRDRSLSPAETAELDFYEQLDHLMTLLKVRAYQAHNAASQ
jgi:hypothetical protein